MGLIFGGIDLKQNYKFVTTKIDGRGSPPISTVDLEMPRVDGKIELSRKLQSRRISITGYVYGKNSAEALTNKDNLIKLISKAYSQEMKLEFPDTNRYIYVKLTGDPLVIGPVGPILNAVAYELTFNFEAYDPLFYGEDFSQQIIGIENVQFDAKIPLDAPVRRYQKTGVDFKLQPYTIVNLLGKYGNFEEDSNGDGVADGWTKSSNVTPSLDTGLFGSFSQKIVAVEPSSEQGIFRDIDNIISGHKYFLTFYHKVSNTANKMHVYLSDKGTFNNQENFFASLTTSTTWQENRKTLTTAKNGARLVLGIGSIEDADEIWLDGVMLVDLTTMGALPSGLKAYFQDAVTNWEDLATTSNITAVDGREQTGEDWLAELIPYVDSCASCGYSWNEGE